MKDENTIGVLICGAGATGLTLAIDLARHGVPFRLIEKMEQPFPGSRGKGIQPRTQEVFEDLGIIDRVVAAGGSYPPMREYHGDGTYTERNTAEHSNPTPAEPYHIALMIPQFQTERLMRERLTEYGHRVEFGTELVGFDQSEEGVTARLIGPEGEEVVHSRYLIGADGGRSFVRGVLGIDFPGKTLGVRAMVADAALTGLDRDVWHQFNNGNMERMLSICPLAGTDLFQIQAVIPLEGAVDLSLEGIEGMIFERTARNDVNLQSVTWASAYSMNARLADRYRVGRVFLVGDAAHNHPPTGGQGLNTSIQDAYNLGWKLAAVLGGAPDSLLDSYERERRPVAEAVLGLTAGLLDAAKRGELRRGREVRQLDIGYPGSPLALDLSARVGSLVGGRAPDAPLLGAAGCPRRLFDLFTGSHWTLIGFEAERDIIKGRKGLHIHRIGAGCELQDVGGHFSDAYELIPGEWVLVRPDGYVATIATPDEASALWTFFAEVGLAGIQQ
ncbi:MULTISPECIES: FAD-dependent oxidoreductase [unclassified Phyllobacterium]|uniref:FAD-dependent oxidoreductase n=1 Tax=unclassified Phyllobacterium TaxID=2638441 RepID=UPI003013072A